MFLSLCGKMRRAMSFGGTHMIHFENDYGEGTYPEILESLTQINFEQTTGYGLDHYCGKAGREILRACELDSADADVHFLQGGTLTNLTIISAALRPHHGVISAYTGHIATHEGGAIEATGHKVLALPSRDGKLSAAQIATFVEQFYQDPTYEHQSTPAMVYLSDLTELGTSYSKQELVDISSVCRDKNLILFLDGARLGYSLCAADSDKSLADVATCCDVFTFGGTKIGLLLGEAVIIRNGMLRRDFRTIMKQKGALMAKGRILGIQFLTLFEKDLWRKGGHHADQQADYLRAAVTEAGYSFLTTTTGNQVFPILPDSLVSELSHEYTYSFWEKTDDTHTAVRFCTSWATKESDTQRLARHIRESVRSTNSFDGRAAEWDDERRKARTKLLTSTIRTELEAGTVCDALEFGCGTGLVGLELIDLFERLTFLDTSSEMIRIVKEKISNLAPGRAQTVCLDLTKGDPLPQQYDLIFSSMALHHVVDVGALLSVFYKYLRKDGRVAIVDLMPVDELFHRDDTGFDGHHGFDPEELSVLFQQAGFSNTRFRTVFSGCKTVGEEDVPYSLFLLTARKDEEV